MKNRHALVDARTGIVTNIVIWEGDQWLPPKDHYIVHSCIGMIGDYWHQDTNSFYSIDGKKRTINEHHKVYDAELSQDEKDRMSPIFERVFKGRRHVIDSTQPK